MRGNQYFVQKQSPGGVLYKKLLLEISKNSQENNCARVSVKITKFLGTFFFTEQQWATASGFQRFLELLKIS